MPHLSRGYPVLVQNLEGLDEETRRVFQALIQQLEILRGNLVDVVNFQEIEFVSQPSRPTPANGRVVAWEDSDATTGQPTHYLVYTDPNSVTVTFRSVETVP